MNPDEKIYDYVMRCLDAKTVTQRDVAVGSGVPYSTLIKIAQRQVTDPAVSTIQKIADFFRARERVGEKAEA